MSWHIQIPPFNQRGARGDFNSQEKIPLNPPLNKGGGCFVQGTIDVVLI